MSDRRIETAELDWSAEAETRNAPRSIFFDDIYFSGEGIAETTHVFLQGNGLPMRFATGDLFTIGELGFGTGLNFLVASAAWATSKKRSGARLHFLSIEKYPLGANDLARAHQAWPALAQRAARLRHVLPPPSPGVHRVEIEPDVTLTLLYGDALAMLSAAEAAVDVWFLDGFSPAKNPEMWRPELMREIARLSNPGATCATFTVAGAVRRGLADAGFIVEKKPGHGNKREMLTGALEKPVKRSIRAPWFARQNETTFASSRRVAVIGAGIAGASLAHALKREAMKPVVFETTAPASGASGNPAGLVMPRLDADETPAARFHRNAYIHTIRLLNGLPKDVFNPCGVIRATTSDKERVRRQKLLSMAALPRKWMDDVGDGLLFPQGGVVDPPAFVRALLSDAEIRIGKVDQLRRVGTSWRVQTTAGEEAFDAVMIANGLDALKFVEARGLPLAGSAGQIDWFPDAAAPETALAFGPYAAPAPKRGLVIGATYAPIAIGAEPRFSPEATQSNLDAVRRAAPNVVKDLAPSASRPRVSVRCTTPDRLPIAGPVPDWGFYAGAYDGLRTGARRAYPAGRTQDGLFVLTGLGSRGLVTAPLCAAIIAAEIAGAPAPVEADIAEALHPARFYIRDLKRNR